MRANDRMFDQNHMSQDALELAATSDIRVRLRMGENAARVLGEQLLAVRGTGQEGRLLDQLWLRTVMVEEWRRTHIAERAAFEACADRLLAALDP